MARHGASLNVSRQLSGALEKKPIAEGRQRAVATSVIPAGWSLVRLVRLARSHISPAEHDLCQPVHRDPHQQEEAANNFHDNFGQVHREVITDKISQT